MDVLFIIGYSKVMFEEAVSKEPQSSRPGLDRKQIPMIALGAVIAILTVIASFLAYKIFSIPDYVVPENIVRAAPHTIYIPKKLPDGYKITDGSFNISEGGLIFQANDPSGSSIAFTEQKKPENFDFEKFYKEQMENAKKLSGTPYPSVIGKLPNGDKTLLSVITDDTWVIASTGAPLGEQDFTTIAKGIKKY